MRLYRCKPVIGNEDVALIFDANSITSFLVVPVEIEPLVILSVGHKEYKLRAISGSQANHIGYELRSIWKGEQIELKYFEQV